MLPIEYSIYFFLPKGNESKSQESFVYCFSTLGKKKGRKRKHLAHFLLAHWEMHT
jgi:hypothetical protein